jgi:hypothetical protein
MGWVVLLGMPSALTPPAEPERVLPETLARHFAKGGYLHVAALCEGCEASQAMYRAGAGESKRTTVIVIGESDQVPRKRVYPKNAILVYDPYRRLFSEEDYHVAPLTFRVAPGGRTMQRRKESFGRWSDLR